MISSVSSMTVLVTSEVALPFPLCAFQEVVLI